MLHEFIIEQRKKRTRTQEFVAKKLGVSRPTYAQIEKGERELTISEATALSNLFNMTLTDLLNEREPLMEVVVVPDEPPKLDPEPQERVRTKDMGKFRQMLLYVLSEVAGRPNIGEAALHILLYFIDLDYYEVYEENLAGVAYDKHPQGPTCRVLKSVLDELEQAGSVTTIENQHFQGDLTKHLPLTLPDLQVLSAQEIKFIDATLLKHAHKTTKALREFSRDDMPWMATNEGQMIHYEFVFYRGEVHAVKQFDDDDEL